METHEFIESQKREVNERLAKLLDEKLAVEEENKSLLNDIKQKDEIIKQLTRENLALNSNLTQIQ